MSLHRLLPLVSVPLLILCAAASAREKVEILRDEFGAPHIFARTAAGAEFGLGYAEAADRLDQLLENLHARKPDVASRLVSLRVHAMVEAYCAGINAFLQENHASTEHVDASMVEAFSRFAYGQFEDSNHVLLAPRRSNANAVIAILSPHRNWSGPASLYEMRIYASEDGLAFAGAAPVGAPFPLMGHNGSVSIAVTGAGAAEENPLDEVWALINAKTLSDAKKALALRQFPFQKFLVGTADGDIYDSGTGTANPSAGFLLSGGGLPQALAKTRELIDAVHTFSLESALSLAFSAEVFKAETWQIRIGKVAPEMEFARMLSGWNRRTEADSRAALAFYLFKMALGEEAAAVEPPEHVSDARVRAALRQAQDRLDVEFPVDATWGTLFRIGRDGARRSWPVSGGTLAAAGMATPRAVKFEKNGPVMMGRGGQAAVEVVLLSRPPKSVMALPLGESNQTGSPHLDDQARELFSMSQAHPTYFGDRKELEKHSKERKELMSP